MGFKEALFGALKKAVDPDNQAAFQKKTGIHQPTFHSIYSGKNTNPQLKAVEAIIDNLDKETFLEFVKKIRPDLHIGVINLEGKHEVSTFNIADINVVLAAMPEIKTRDNLRDVLRDIEPIFRLQIPEKYFPSDFAVRVLGHSMEPDIPDRSAVGLTILKSDRDFVAGETYLCHLPYEGLVLRRVVVSSTQDALEFQALHRDRDAYRSQIMHPDEAIKLIFARLTWVAYRK